MSKVKLVLSRNLVFHLELFLVKGEFLLCEIAARRYFVIFDDPRPGGSIALLIDQQLGGQKLFPKLEFRFSNGLPITMPTQILHSWVGDVLIPRKKGTLEYLPESLDIPEVTLFPIAKVGSSYNGFEMGKMNTAVRILATSTIGFEHLNHLLEISAQRFNSMVKYSKS